MGTGFSDEPHIERIAEALWTREPVGSAALLVGAGFSRNALPVRAGAGTMPGWNDIYQTMVDQLYPIVTGDQVSNASRVAPREWLLQQTGATSAYLRVAEEFEAQFGRDTLDKLILRHVPDRQFAPGRLHEMLVQLPWADIMTTNWDTLLERATESAEERVYDVVRTVDEIPEARAPRVIKLHGSFPSHRPFVFTEEDFRTYPARAGAFVNLAQQLAMENTLVLLGFSGDDPNFLFWSGWVRDRLGLKAPLIYLVGVLGLSAARRKMLEARRIQPIDLAELPKYLSWPESQRMANAHQWFLERLRAAEPYAARRWPRPPAGFVPPLSYVSPRVDPRAPLPDLEYTADRPSVELVRELVEQWQHNRSVYPGWIVTPLDATELLWSRIDRRIYDIIQGAKQLDSTDRLIALDELNWQQERALIPLVLTVDDVIIELLDDLAERYEQLPSDAARRFRALALAIIRHAREENDPVLFNRWMAWLEPRLADDAEARDRLTYEHCLQLRADLDIDALEAKLKAWTVNSDTFWLLRKAGLLADLGRDEEADELSAQALSAIRAQTLRGNKDIASWSRESFALLFRASVLHSQLGSWLENKPERDRFDMRQDELQAKGCPGKGDFFELVERLVQVPPPLKQMEERTRQFDLGSTNTTRYFGQSDARLDRLLAYQALRFIEEGGLPIRIGRAGVAGQLLGEAARWLMDVAPSRALDAFMRASPGASVKEIDKVLTRTAVARMEVSEANRLIDRAFRLIAPAKARVEKGTGEARFWIERLSFTLEIASRIVLRVPDRAPALLATALDLHLMPKFARRIDLGQALGAVIVRSLEAASTVDLDGMLLAVFQHPVTPNAGRFASDVEDFAGLLSSDFRPENPGPEWRAVLADTIEALRNTDTRQAASRRLIWLWGAKLIEPDERTAIAEALWSPEHLDGDLPGGTLLLPSAFVALPKIDGVDPNAAVAAIHFRSTPLDDHLVGDGALTAALQNTGVAISDDALIEQIQRLHVYLLEHQPKPDFRHPFGDNEAELVENAARILAALAVRALRVPAALEPLRKLLADVRYPMRLEPAYPALSKLGLVSEHDAISGVKRLLTQVGFEESHLVGALLDQIAWYPPFSSVIEAVFWDALAQVVASRRPAVLSAALRFFSHFFRRWPERVPASEDDLLGLGLMLILNETDARTPAEHLEYDPYLVRFFGSSLVTSMAAQGRGDPAVHAAWSIAIDNDPLPDARRARVLALREKAAADSAQAAGKGYEVGD